MRCKMKRNPNYWKEGAGFFETAEVLSIKDSTSRTNALTTGEIHVMNRVDPKVVNLVSRRPGIRIEETSGNQHYTMPMHTDKAPFNDNHVRMALKLAMDRQEVLDKVLNGHGYLGNDHPIGKANRFYAEDLPQRAYDPEKAKWHLKQAGMENLKVDLSSSDAAFVGAVDAAVLFKEQAKQAGIDVNVKREPADGYWSDVWLKEPFCMSYWGGRPTEDWMFQVAYAAGASWNATNWKHERFNKLLLEGPRRAGHREAPPDVHRDAGNPARSGRRRDPDVRQLHHGPERRRPARRDGRELGPRRAEVPRALVDGLSGRRLG
ncbi:MAG: ABC transporter substrate-binding protein [Rhodovibrio sp.]|nr:ABC transporter substrate-binding protein [Rhodovibrio sp.]